MTSDAQRFEGLQEDGSSDVTAPHSSGEVTALLSPAIDEGLPSLTAPLPPPAEKIARPALSAGYIPIQSDKTSPAGQPEGPQSLEAFEHLERDLAELASACSGLGVAENDSPDIAEPLALAAGVPHFELAVSEVQEADILLDSLRIPEPNQGHPHTPVDATTHLLSSQATSPISHEETSIMNAQAQPTTTEAANARASVESAVTVRQSSVLETDGVLHDVQSTLDSLAGMAHGLSQQKLEIVKMREALEERRLATLERERQLAEREERLSQQEQRLQEEKQGIERIAEHNATVLAERSTALQALAETVDSRDRATTKRAEVLGQEQQSIDRQQNQLRARVQELDDREAGLQRQSGELADRFKQLLDAKERFGAIVKSFNETVRFNTTYSAISKTVGTGAEEA
ncbi:hypothetical protein [Pseudomonas sp. PDM20]|uniref:hypothetical protein n=1 Tax=Pseudomonas sp. PDM20 TaxID=2769254 RepID=UPI00177E96BD|nr:hypothetical protein [Pseudomonas sp. PDM20]MBD9684900.1 hypothetical protein [Pseudomonas sp. PDM20]